MAGRQKQKENDKVSNTTRTPALQRQADFHTENLNRPASKSNTRQTERLMLLLMAFN